MLLLRVIIVPLVPTFFANGLFTLYTTKSKRLVSCSPLRYGTVEGPINFGVMREGDSCSVRMKVALVLGFDKETGANQPRPTPGR